ncbi:transporter substrate-binding domain-containing protein [Bdellovibrio sp. SKB1291214]|uniref:substrate-binding periplasmic protein n=1 Tax=Bdellovibrio sp. SKB1291214 TaxID=1732569 RepID=UPI0020CC1AA5|nr:transporter substrate-binding domain-containing protein [Bdellovibrio sp. SKB1291214]UYL08500.1 transporter substrate-binding domain-containing protein [Bdellovibrio sp. SKB1291214]
MLDVKKPGILLAFALFFAMPVHAKKVFRVLMEDNWPPYAYVKDGQPAGLSIDLIKAAMRIEGAEVQIQQVPYLRCMALTEPDGKEIACANTAKNEELAAKYVFPTSYLFRSRGLIVASKRKIKESIRKFKKVSDLEYKTVALPSGFTFGKEFDDNTRILRYYTVNDMTSLKLVESGRVKFAAIDEMVLYYYLNHHPELKDVIVPVIDLTNEPIYMQLSKTQPEAIELRDKFERGMTALKASPEYEQLLQKYLGKGVPVDKFK